MVIGSGTMGSGIAHVFAQNGLKVSLVDVRQDMLDKAIATITQNLNRQIAKGNINEETKKATLANISVFLKPEDAVANADLAVEAVTEDKKIKQELFKKLDSICGTSTIFATNTSSISITEIAAATKRADRVIGMHFMNPVPVMKLVEVIRGKETSNETTQIIMELSRKLGKVAVEVNDAPGFVSNRILMPLLNEAVFTLHEGIAGVYEIDTVLKLGMSHPMGPLQLADFIGLDVCLSIQNVLYQGFGTPKYAPCPLLEEMVKAGELGVKSKKGFYDYSSGGKELVVAERFRKKK